MGSHEQVELSQKWPPGVSADSERTVLYFVLLDSGDKKRPIYKKQKNQTEFLQALGIRQ